MTHTQRMSLEKGKVKVKWEYIGEGYNGDYNINDEHDVQLLRFSVYKKEHGDWRYVDDSSYCTNFPLFATDEQKEMALDVIMSHVYHKVLAGQSIKKICEFLSHIDEACVVEIPTELLLV
jgi:hypothetical protein